MRYSNYIGYVCGVMAVLLLGSQVWSDHEEYQPGWEEMSLVTYLQQQIVDTYRADWTHAQTAEYTESLQSYISTTDSERIAWILDELMTYIALKPSGDTAKSEAKQATVVADVPRDEDKDAEVIVDVPQETPFVVEVTVDGAGSLNIRSGPGSEHGVLRTLSEGSRATVTQIEGDRYQIDYQGVVGWVASSYVQQIGDADPDQNIVTSTRVDAGVIKRVEISPNDVGSLRVRSAPRSDSEVIGKIDVGGQIDIYDEVSGYFLVDFAGRDGWIAVDYTHLAGTDAPSHHLTQAVTAPDTGLSKNKKEFLDTYRPLVDSKDKEILGLCTKYYDEIDSIAKKYDFPVELIIATWYREHTCKFFNPSNTWGNFQITSAYYAPGDITRAEFEQQVIDFIKFSQDKRDYYDAIQTYGPEPVSLSYDSFDLTSIRKQAILYNGIVGELETNVYANQNFGGVRVGGADGIVAMFLKVLKWSSERN